MNEVRVLPVVSQQYQENSYVLFCDEDDRALVIDPGAEADELLELLAQNGKRLTDIALTHGHFDHIMAVAALKHTTNARIHIHALDAPMLTRSDLNMSCLLEEECIQVPGDCMLPESEDAENAILEAAGITLSVLHTPGHTRGGVCFYIPEQSMIFTGDTLFRDTFGRTDFPGGSAQTLRRSLRLLFELPGGTAVYPGHGMPTTIARERGDEK